jgi:mycofactocin system creatininase family protein
VSSLGDRTSPEVRDERPILLVPLGSTEQHGPHLPLDTDTRIAVALCEQAASSPLGGSKVGRGPTVLVAPAVAYGASGEHQGFAGTLSMGQVAFEQVVVELGRSAGADYALVVFVNGHGGNAEPLARGLATLHHEGRPVMAWAPRLEEGDSHAGHVETSVLLALAPDVVRLDRAEAGETRPLHEILPELRAGGLVAVTPNGVLGDPRGASAEAGRVLVDHWVGDLVAAVRGALDGRIIGADGTRR